MGPKRSSAVSLLLLALTTAVAGFLAELPIARAGDPGPTLLFILDASGSMWGRVGGKTKIEAAREVMGKLVRELSPEVSAGLLAYGHRKKGDCGDIEMVAPPAPGQGASIATSLDKLVPKGKTPIAASLTMAGEKLKGIEGETTVVLVSDGIETCEADPCAVAKALHEQGIRLTIHVVGFDVGGEAAEQLRCIAENGGGQYFDARDAGDLGTALNAVKRHIVEKTPLPPPPPAPPQAPAPAQPKVETGAVATERVRAAGPGTVKLVPAPWVRMPPNFWVLAEAETDAEAGRSQLDSVKIKPGTYQISWRQIEHGASVVPLSEAVKVESGKVVEVPIATGLRLTVPEGLAVPYEWSLVDPADEKVATFGGKDSLQPQVVPQGRYRLFWRQREHDGGDVELGEVSIEEGKLNDKVLGSGLRVALPEWLKPPYSYTLTRDGKRTMLSLVGAVLLCPGEYELSWRQTEHGHGDVAWGRLTVPEGGFVPSPVTSGLMLVAEGGAKPPYEVSATNLETKSRSTMKHSFGPMPLPPGAYEIELRQDEHGGKATNIADDLKMGPNQLVELEI